MQYCIISFYCTVLCPLFVQLIRIPILTIHWCDVRSSWTLDSVLLFSSVTQQQQESPGPGVRMIEMECNFLLDDVKSLSFLQIWDFEIFAINYGQICQ